MDLKLTYLAISMVVACGAGGCAPTANTAKNTVASTQAVIASGDPVIATVGPTVITASQLSEPLMKAYGFTVFKAVVQCAMSRDEAKIAGIAITPQDILAERQKTLENMFPKIETDDEREKVLDQFLAQPRPGEQIRTRTEFDLLIETNANLRAIAKKSLAGTLTDEKLRQEFDEQYGASVQVRHIALSNPQEIAAAQQQLVAGKSFGEVARTMSRNIVTAKMDGLLPPFTAYRKDIPENFRKAAFSLKEGEISDPVQADGSYHLIKLEKIIKPKAVKFEDVKDGLRESLEDRYIQEGVNTARLLLGQRALALMNLKDPILKAEFERGLKARDTMIHDRSKMNEEIAKQRPASQPTTLPVVPVVPAGPAIPPAQPSTALSVPSTLPSKQ